MKEYTQILLDKNNKTQETESKSNLGLRLKKGVAKIAIFGAVFGAGAATNEIIQNAETNKDTSTTQQIDDYYTPGVYDYGHGVHPNINGEGNLSSRPNQDRPSTAENVGPSNPGSEATPQEMPSVEKGDPSTYPENPGS